MLIKTPKPALSRRTFLRGSAGIALALPALEMMMADSARAQEARPHRYVAMFAGMSIGRDNACYLGGGNRFAPATTGADYALTRGLTALGTHGVKGDVTVISNLLVPWDVDGVVPPGGRVGGWHSSSMQYALLQGTTDGGPRGPSSDQVAANAVGSGARFRSLEYKVQAAGYHDDQPVERSMSYGVTGQPNAPITSPNLAYQSLFTSFTPVDPAERAAALRALERKRSVIDFVHGSAARLRARLGRADKQRLERHFDELRALEGRLQQIEPDVESACQQLDINAGYAVDPAVVNTTASHTEGWAIGYAQEQQRGRLLCDLIHMAFVCDLSRVATLMLTQARSFMNVASLVPSGIVTDLHEMSHCQGTNEDFEDMLNWHVDQWAYLVKKLKDTPDVDATLLDRTALALVFEGGNGTDPTAGRVLSPHSSENMVMLVAGAGMTPGLHIDGNRLHPSQGLLACTRAVGHTGGLGVFSTPIPGLGV